MMKSGIQFVSFKACFVLPASGRVDAGDGQDGRPRADFVIVALCR